MTSKKMKNKKGITFIEAIINIYIYTLLISVCLTVSIAYLKTRINIRQKQQAIEEISLTMNEMAKKIRMSECQSECGGIDEININPNESGGGEITYYLDGSNNLHYQDSIAGTDDIMLDKVKGEFYITREGGIPLITIKLWKMNKAGTAAIAGTVVKTSVSLRSGYGDDVEE